VHSVVGAGLGPLGFLAPQCVRVSWVWRGRRGGARTTSCAGALSFKTVSFSPFQTEFSSKIQTEVLQTLNTKVVEQVTLFKNAKGSIGFFSLV
jgi:hypothetical protein